VFVRLRESSDSKTTAKVRLTESIHLYNAMVRKMVYMEFEKFMNTLRISRKKKVTLLQS